MKTHWTEDLRNRQKESIDAWLVRNGFDGTKDLTGEDQASWWGEEGCALYFETEPGRLAWASETIGKKLNMPLGLPSQEALAAQLSTNKCNLQRKLAQAVANAEKVLGRRINIKKAPEEYTERECEQLCEQMPSNHFDFLLRYYENCAKAVDPFFTEQPCPSRLNNRITKAYRTKDKLIEDLLNKSVSQHLDEALARCRETGYDVEHLEENMNNVKLLLAKSLTEQLPGFCRDLAKAIESGTRIVPDQNSQKTVVAAVCKALSRGLCPF